MNQAALITGASRGIGRGIALALAKAGCDLVINYARNEEAARQTAAECVAQAAIGRQPIRAEICQADIALDAGRRALLAFTRATFGRLDLLVNNAGVAPEVRADLLEASEASFDRLMNINVKGPFFLTQLAARWMIEQVRAASQEFPYSQVNPTPSAEPASSPTAARHPKIITITSISAYTASVNRGDYCLAKAALAMLTPLFATRLAEYGINVYEIRPGIIATDMIRPVQAKYEKLIQDGLTPIPRLGTPADIGKAVVAIAQDAFPFSTGEVLNIDGGFHLRRL